MKHNKSFLSNRYKSAEPYLMNECKKIEKEHEDFIMTTINEDMSKFIDEKGFAKYSEVQKKCDEVKDVINKVTDYNSLEIHIKEFKEIIDMIYDYSHDVEDYFININRLRGEVIGLIESSVNDRLIELEAFQKVCYDEGYRKASNNIKLTIKKLRTTTATLLANIYMEAIKEYERLIIEEFDNCEYRIKEKIEQIKSFIPKESTEDERVRLEKIYNIDKMNQFLRRLGFEPIRQKGTSHKIYSDGLHSVPVPQHGKDINKGLGYEIQKEVLGDKDNRHK